jgi:hypothetical protein
MNVKFSISIDGAEAVLIERMTSIDATDIDWEDNRCNPIPMWIAKDYIDVIINLIDQQRIILQALKVTRDIW